MVALVGIRMVAEPLARECAEYATTVAPDPDRRGASVTFYGWDIRDPVSITLQDKPPSERPPRRFVWAIHVGFVPCALRVGHLGEVVLLGDVPTHAVVVLDFKGRVVGDRNLASFLTGEPLSTALTRMRRGEPWFDEADFTKGHLSEGTFRLGGFGGVSFSHPPHKRAPALFQGTTVLLGATVLYVRVDKEGYGWFDLKTGDLLSTDVPTRVRT